MADIQSQKFLKQPLSGKKPASGDTGFLMVPPIRALVPRGDSVEIPVRSMPSSDALRVKVVQEPAHGRLERIDNRPGAVAVFRYIHDRNSQEPEDAFTFLLSDPLSGTSGRHTARLFISNPGADLAVSPAGPVDFGKIPIGSTATREVVLVNRFGSTASGTLHVSPPWKLEGDAAISLPEGGARKITILFQPGAEGEQSSRLSMDPLPGRFPDIQLAGSALPPFLYLGANPVVATMDNPEVPLVLSNTLGEPVSVRLRRPPGDLRGTQEVSLPPHGTGTITVSTSQLEIPPEGARKYRLLLESGSYGQSVDLAVRGRKADPMLELLHGAEASATKVGFPLVLEGIVRNPSDVERSIDLSLHDPENPGTVLSRQTESIPAKGLVTFKLNWVPRVVGSRSMKVELMERGRLVDSQSWNITVSASQTTSVSRGMDSPSRALSLAQLQPKAPVQPVARPASSDETERLVLDLKPILEPGILWNHLLLRWRYYGSSSAGFAVETLHRGNTLSNRTGLEESEAWKPVPGATPRFENGFWTARLKMPLPGRHEYRVYPLGKGEVLLSTLSLEMTDGMFYWPMLRALLATIFLIMLVKVIRRRNWRRGRRET